MGMDLVISIWNKRKTLYAMLQLRTSNWDWQFHKQDGYFELGLGPIFIMGEHIPYKDNEDEEVL